MVAQPLALRQPAAGAFGAVSGARIGTATPTRVIGVRQFLMGVADPALIGDPLVHQLLHRFDLRKAAAPTQGDRVALPQPFG